MPVGITDLAHSLRKHAGPQQPPLPLGHWHQLVCAALGHKSLASFQAAQVAEREPPQFDHVSYVVADVDLLAQRANEFSLSLTKDRLRTLVKAAFGERLPRMKVTHSYADLAAEFQEAAQLAVLSADEVNSAIAGANHDGIKEIYFESDLEPHRATLDEPFTETVSVQVTLGLDLERPYWGHQIMCEAAVTSTRSGLRCFDKPEVVVVSARLDHDDDGPPVRSLAQALADALGIDVKEAEDLVDAEPLELSGHSGEVVYDYEFDFANHASPALAAKLMRTRGSLRLKVGPDFFEGVRSMDFPN